MRHREPVLRSYAVVHPPGTVHLPTQAGWQQLLQAGAGALTATATGARWTVPSGRVLVVPPDVAVEVTTGHRPTPVRCLYLSPSIAETGGEVRVVEPTPLGRALLDRAAALAPADGADPDLPALLALLRAEVLAAPSAPLALRLPTDPRARSVAERILDDPSPDLEDLVQPVGASRRTIERLFRDELGTSPARWQRRARVLRGLELLEAGHSVSS
ncbi:MAG: AraC family transcriptional regulator, partial [Actinomycetota bacterium]